MKKKRFAATLMAVGVLCCGICGCGNGMDNSNNSQVNTMAADGKDNIGNGEQLTSAQQIKLIEDNTDIWYVEPAENWINYVGVTDLDNNGRLEVTVSREEAGSYVTTQFFMYEINEDGTGLTKVNVDVGGIDFMPDISLNSVLNCYRAADGSLNYVLTDCNMGDYSIYQYSDFLMKLENGGLTFTKFSSMICNFADNASPENYYDAENNSISSEEYSGLEETVIRAKCGECERLYQIMGFHFYEDISQIGELLQASYEKAALLNSEEYEAYVADQRGSSSSASLGIEEVGSLYYTDIDDSYLKNRIWSSFYVFNFETGEETDYIRDGGAGSRFEKELIFFGNDGTGYYLDCSGVRTDFSWSCTETGMGEAVVNGESYVNAVFGYTLVDSEGVEHQAIAFEFRNEYIYAMSE